MNAMTFTSRDEIAHANLIKAAPSLFSALEGLLHALSRASVDIGGDDSVEAWKAAENALREAKGLPPYA